jgi:hypothetical protein
MFSVSVQVCGSFAWILIAEPFSPRNLCQSAKEREEERQNRLRLTAIVHV